MAQALGFQSSPGDSIVRQGKSHWCMELYTEHAGPVCCGLAMQCAGLGHHPGAQHTCRQAPPQNYELRILTLTRPPRDSNAHSRWRSTCTEIPNDEERPLHSQREAYSVLLQWVWLKTSHTNETSHYCCGEKEKGLSLPTPNVFLTILQWHLPQCG